MLIFLTLVLTTFSCTKDNEEPKNIPPELIGKWKITHHFSPSGSGLEGTWIEVNTGLEQDIWFKKNGEIIMKSLGENCEEGTFNVMENEIHFKFPCGESTLPIDSLSNTTLITNVSYIKYELNKYIKVVE